MSYVFTRSRYYYEMHYHQNRKWELDRMATKPAIRNILEVLSQSGGINNCDRDSWERFFTVERSFHDDLRDEFVVFNGRALWRMRMFRWKRASLDRAISAMLDKSTRGEPVHRPLVVAVGNAKFRPCGPGELPAPTSALSIAIRRGINNLHKRTNRRVRILAPWEHRTTMCCCACGSVTSKAMIMRRNKRTVMRENGWSGRLRTCTCCNTEGKVRDRDIQASRNILWLAIHEYYGLERPDYLRRQ